LGYINPSSIFTLTARVARKNSWDWELGRNAEEVIHCIQIRFWSCVIDRAVCLESSDNTSHQKRTPVGRNSSTKDLLCDPADCRYHAWSMAGCEDHSHHNCSFLLRKDRTNITVSHMCWALLRLLQVLDSQRNLSQVVTTTGCTGANLNGRN
jgi:hypothetical protein